MARVRDPVCGGTGKLKHSLCAGMGYRMEGGERVTCFCSGGYQDCMSCGGTGWRPETVPAPGARPAAEARVRSREPLSLAGLQRRYEEAVADAHRCREEVLAQLQHQQLDRRTRLVWDSYQMLRRFLTALDLEAPGVEDELNAAIADLKKAGRDELASLIARLTYPCSRIGAYRLLIAQSEERTAEK